MASCSDSMLEDSVLDVPGRSTLQLDEYSAGPSPLPAPYCRLLTEQQFEETGCVETEKALKALIEHLDTDSSDYLRLMRKRKLEEVENNGVVSFIKSRVWSTVLGSDRYEESLVSTDECRQRLGQLTNGMMLVHQYAQETRRSSQRLVNRYAGIMVHTNRENYDPSHTPTSVYAEAPGGKRERRDEGASCPSLARPSLRSVDNVPASPQNFTQVRSPQDWLWGKGPQGGNSEEKSTASFIPLPPPPPPVPLPPPLLSMGNNKKFTSPPAASDKTGSLAVVVTKTPTMSLAAGLQQELKSTDPLKRLRSTQIARSPGGTPALNPGRGAATQSRGGAWSPSREPLTAALTRVLRNKFKNVRSPSPSFVESPSTIGSPAAFSP